MKRLLNTAPFWLLVMCLAVFIPLLFLLGFGISDDLSFVAHTGGNFWNDLSYSLSRAGHISRPIYGLVQTITLHLFGDNYVYYNILRISIWFVLIYQAYRVFRYYFRADGVWLYLFFLAFPIFSSAHLFNFFQMGYLLSIVFYLMALACIQDEEGFFLRKNHFSYVFLSLLALFSCEIVFPLFVFPLLVNYFQGTNGKTNRTLILSSVLIFVLFFIHKFLIGPLYQLDSSVYGFAFTSNSVLQSLYYVVALLLEIPLLLIEVIPFYFSEPLLLLSLLAIPFIYLVKRKSTFELDKKRLIPILLTLLACSCIFLLSNYPSVTFGLYNKMLLPAHILYALLLAMLILALLKSRYHILGYVVAVLWFASMEMQLINTVRSWNQREATLIQIAEVLNKNETDDGYIVVEVPYFLALNYNNEHVFALNDDFHGGLELAGYKGNSRHVFPFCAEMLDAPTYYSNHNIHLVMKQNRMEHFRLFRNGQLSEEELSLEELKKVPFRKHKECLRSRIRAYLIDILR